MADWMEVMARRDKEWTMLKINFNTISTISYYAEHTPKNMSAQPEFLWVDGVKYEITVNDQKKKIRIKLKRDFEELKKKIDSLVK